VQTDCSVGMYHLALHRINLFDPQGEVHAHKVTVPIYHSNDLSADSQTSHFDVTNNARRANATSLRA
jgi:hypothetical protein